MKSNVVKMSCKRGFTLIELLVVVLIIGVLAAVALPQYNKVVKKAQGAEVLNAIDAMDKVMVSYYLTHDDYDDLRTVTSEELDVALPDLKYWDYGNNEYGPDSSPGPSFIQMGCGSGVFLSKPRGIFVQAQWSKGHLKYVQCYGDRKDECGDYFNCNWTERILYPCPGPEWCSGTVVRDCYLDL